MTGGAHFYADMAWFLSVGHFDSDIECIVTLLLIINMARYIYTCILFKY